MDDIIVFLGLQNAPLSVQYVVIFFIFYLFANFILDIIRHFFYN